MQNMFMLATLPLISTASSALAAPQDSKCKNHVGNIAIEKPLKPTMRSLGHEPPAAQMAAVIRRVDNCAVLVITNPQLAGEPRWKAPAESPAARKYQTFDK